MYKHKNTHKIHPRTVLLIVAITLLLCGVAAVILLQTRNDNPAPTSSKPKPINSVDYTPAKPSDNAATEDKKIKDSPPTLNTPANSPDYSISITRASIDNTTKELVVGTLVTGAKTGTCTFEAIRHGQASVTETSQVTAQNNTYTCNNFIIPFSRFPVAGEWIVKVSVSADSGQSSNQWPRAIVIPDKQ